MRTPNRSRIVFLDWLRGLAAVIMLQGHTFHALLQPGDREHPVFIFSQFFGGQAAAIFLFLTGVTYGLGMSRRDHLPPGQRILAALRRARYLFLLAILFRLQTWSFSWPYSPWTDLLRVDVLNAMGATAALLSVLALASGLHRARWAALAGVALAALSPVMAGLDVSGVPGPISNYFVPSGEFFSIFPWGAYLAFGLAAGTVIPLVQRENWSRVMQWAALTGFALLLSGQYFSNLPYSVYAHSDFWLNSPALVACKLGNTFLLGSGAFLWTEYLAPLGFSWVRQLGTNSLLVYWVHVEIVYGRWLGVVRGHLGIWGCLAASVTIVALMVGLSLVVRRAPWREMWNKARALLQPAPAPAIEAKEEVSSYQ